MLLLALGVPPKIVQERQGHADVGMPLNRYSHLIPDVQGMAASLLAMVTMDS
jgi:integrase